TQGILSPAAHFCVSGCGAAESAPHHLFISCRTFGSLWALVRSWIGIPSVAPLLSGITFSVYIKLVDLERAGHFCNSFGLFAFELCGRKEITDCSEAQPVLLISCWTRSNSFPIGG
ncbi:hypothetical protein L195_g055224, partial [Trifolium pratense]